MAKTLKEMFPKQPKLYDCSAIEKLMNAYCEHDGNAYTITEGSLGYGEMLLYGDGLKVCIVREVYVNAWSSGHTVRFYNECPKKYREYLA